MAESVSEFAAHPKQSWKLLTVLFSLANLLEVAVIAHFVLFTPAFLTTIGFSKAEIDAWTGPIASAGFLAGIWFVPFWGVLADRYGRKPLILRSYYVEVLAMALAAVSHNIWLYLVARSLTGFALGNTGLMYASLTEAAPSNRVAFASDQFVLTVTPVPDPPVVWLSAPTNGAQLLPTNIPLTALASDPDNDLAYVEFFANGA